MTLDKPEPWPGFWKEKKVFLTGHTGFKGTWLSLWLHSMGAQVIGYSLKPATKPSMYEICRMDEVIISYFNDVRDLTSLSTALCKADPDIVIHMAAQPLVRESYHDPVATFEVNMMGTVHLLEAVRQAVRHGSRISAVINVTTDKCYDNREWAYAYRETDALGGADPYSGSKVGSEVITESYRRAFFHPQGSPAPIVPVATARAGNVIGGGDWSKDRLVPDGVRAILQHQPITLRNPAAIRPWQHVLDPLFGYLLLAQNLATSRASVAKGWNFGPDHTSSTSVEQFTSLLCEKWGEDASFTSEASTRQPHEAHYLSLDSSMARQELGWRPRWDLGTALTHTVEWYKAWQRQEDMSVLTLQQINEYMKGVVAG